MEDHEHKLTKAINNDIYKSLILCPSPNVVRSLSWRRFRTLPMSTFAKTLNYILLTKLIVIRLEMLVMVNRSLEKVSKLPLMQSLDLMCCILATIINVRP